MVNRRISSRIIVLGLIGLALLLTALIVRFNLPPSPTPNLRWAMASTIPDSLLDDIAACLALPPLKASEELQILFIVDEPIISIAAHIRSTGIEPLQASGWQTATSSIFTTVARDVGMHKPPQWLTSPQQPGNDREFILPSHNAKAVIRHDTTGESTFIIQTTDRADLPSQLRSWLYQQPQPPTEFPSPASIVTAVWKHP